jgi:hypothetical protein
MAGESEFGIIILNVATPLIGTICQIDGKGAEGTKGGGNTFQR